MADKVWIATGATPASWDTAGNWSPSGEPGAADNVRIPAGTAPIAGSDQTANTLGVVIVEDGYTGGIGTDGIVPIYLQMKCARFEFAGGGKTFLDLNSSAIVPRITKTFAAPAGSFGLYLKGSALAGISLLKGSVGIAVLIGETASVTTALVVGDGAMLGLGSGVTITTLDVYAGRAIVRSAGTNLNLWGGTVTTEEAGAWTTVTLYGGRLVPNSSGTISTLVARGGACDLFASGVARTITSLQLWAGCQFDWNKEAVAVTTWSPQESQSIATRKI